MSAYIAIIMPNGYQLAALETSEGGLRPYLQLFSADWRARAAK
jgi:hypothetical protein